MLRIELLPAHHGDAILVEYGSSRARQRVLIDGGTPNSFAAVRKRLARIAPVVDVELFVVTHVDADHIGGAVALLAHAPALLRPKDVWFNGHAHLVPDRLGPELGEQLTTALRDLQLPWNAAFGGKSVVVPDKGRLPVKALAGGASLTLLSPTWATLGKLDPVWKRECEAAGIVPGAGAALPDVLGKRAPPTRLDMDTLLADKFKSDTAPANGSSIAFLFEYDGKRVLFGADAHPGVLDKSLQRLGKGPHACDAVKLAHHGSRRNTSTALLSRLSTGRFLVSTDSGTFGHPDPEAIAKLVNRSGTKWIGFNYDTPYTRPWANAQLRSEHDYEVDYPDSEGHLVLDL